METYFKFKALLEYFVSHLNFVQNKDTTSGGYLQYIKPLIDEGVFKYTGQGYAGANIQNQIKAFDVFEGDQVFINIQQNYGDYRSSKSYLNWAGTGINIIAIWKGDTLHSLGQEEYLYWEDNPSRKNLEINKTLTELGLFTDTLNNDLINFYDNYRNILLRYKANERSKKMKPIIDLLEYKKQIILQGPPGTGKTRLAKQLATELVEIDFDYSDMNLIKTGDSFETQTDKTRFVVKEVSEKYQYFRVKSDNAKNEYTVNFKQVLDCVNAMGWNDKTSEWNSHGNSSYLQVLAKNIVERKCDQAEAEQYSLVQFHSSYTYEDFVRGIVVESNGNTIAYKTINKTLGEFAEKAKKNWDENNKEEEILSKEKWIEEQFDLFVEFIEESMDKNHENIFELTDSVKIISIEADAFRYTGNDWKHGSNRMLFKDIKQAYIDGNKSRQEIKKNSNLSGLAKEHASYYVRMLDSFEKFLNNKNLTYTSTHVIKPKLKNYVLIIDEINRANLSSVLGELIYALEYREKSVESMYRLENGDNKLTLPPNLYIIGTMNTADRSVGHIDYAIRRRFAFVDLLPKDLSEELGDKFAQKLFNSASKLFDENLSPEFSKKEVQIGHSYFIDKSEEGGDMEIRLEYEIKPILREYVKDGVLIGDDIEAKIDNLGSFL